MDLNYHKNLQYWLESIVVESQCETNQYHNHNEQSDAQIKSVVYVHYLHGMGV